MPGSRSISTRTRRREILDAALALFLEHGVSATTTDDIRDRSGASVGSLYYHFAKGKEAIASALYLDAIAEYQHGFLTELRRHRDAGAGVRATVRYHLRWVEDHPQQARFLFNYGDLAIRGRTHDELAELNRRLLTEVRSWAAEVGAADLLDRPIDVVTALWLGPAQQFARRWLAGDAVTSIERAAWIMADAAWAALSSAVGPK
jgi:AcrR family transcriptional regulator